MPTLRPRLPTFTLMPAPRPKDPPRLPYDWADACSVESTATLAQATSVKATRLSNCGSFEYVIRSSFEFVFEKVASNTCCASQWDRKQSRCQARVFHVEPCFHVIYRILRS